MDEMERVFVSVKEAERQAKKIVEDARQKSKKMVDDGIAHFSALKRQKFDEISDAFESKKKEALKAVQSEREKIIGRSTHEIEGSLQAARKQVGKAVSLVLKSFDSYGKW